MQIITRTYMKDLRLKKLILLLIVLISFGTTGISQINTSKIYTPEEIRKMDAMQQTWDQLTNDTISYKAEIKSLRLQNESFTITALSLMKSKNKAEQEREECYAIVTAKNKQLEGKDKDILKLNNRLNASKAVIIGVAIAGFVGGVIISK